MNDVEEVLESFNFEADVVVYSSADNKYHLSYSFDYARYPKIYVIYTDYKGSESSGEFSRHDVELEGRRAYIDDLEVGDVVYSQGDWVRITKKLKNGTALVNDGTILTELQSTYLVRNTKIASVRDKVVESKEVNKSKLKKYYPEELQQGWEVYTGDTLRTISWIGLGDYKEFYDVIWDNGDQSALLLTTQYESYGSEIQSEKYGILYDVGTDQYKFVENIISTVDDIGNKVVVDDDGNFYLLDENVQVYDKKEAFLKRKQQIENKEYIGFIVLPKNSDIQPYLSDKVVRVQGKLGCEFVFDIGLDNLYFLYPYQKKN